MSWTSGIEVKTNITVRDPYDPMFSYAVYCSCPCCGRWIEKNMGEVHGLSIDITNGLFLDLECPGHFRETIIIKVDTVVQTDNLLEDA